MAAPGEMSRDPWDGVDLELHIYAILERYSEEVLDRLGEDDPALRFGHFVAGSMLDYKLNHVGGAPGHWTREDVEGYLLDYCPRKLSPNPEVVADTLPSVEEFLRFLDAAEMLGGASLNDLVSCCTELADEFHEAVSDRSNWGPSKALHAQMQAEGVDPTDPEALQAWLADFNSRSRSERDAVVGPTLGQAKRVPGAPGVHHDSMASPRVRRVSRSQGGKGKAAKAARKRNRRR